MIVGWRFFTGDDDGSMHETKHRDLELELEVGASLACMGPGTNELVVGFVARSGCNIEHIELVHLETECANRF
jgi:hypothetical protein